MSFELRVEDFKKAPLNLSLIAINVLFFIIVNIFLGNTILFQLAQINSEVLTNGEYYRLFSSLFVHANASHVFNNLLSLLILGTATERICKKWQYLLIYFSAGLLGSVASLIIMPPNTLSLGASGAIAGLMGAMLIMIPRRDPRLKIYALIYLVSFLIQSFSPGIGTWAHIFGLLAGLLIGYIIKKSRLKRGELY